MTPKLIILSDLWGFENNHWLSSYLTLLSPVFNIKTYDCGKLGQVDVSSGNEEQIHHAFVTGGIDRAVNQLLALEREPVQVLGFSIGGTVAWKAALQGLKVPRFCAVSATRLRHEQVGIDCQAVKLYFGKDDLFAPEIHWFDQMQIPVERVEGQGHLLYQAEAHIPQVCDWLVAGATTKK